MLLSFPPLIFGFCFIYVFLFASLVWYLAVWKFYEHHSYFVINWRGEREQAHPKHTAIPTAAEKDSFQFFTFRPTNKYEGMLIFMFEPQLYSKYITQKRCAAVRMHGVRGEKESESILNYSNDSTNFICAILSIAFRWEGSHLPARFPHSKSMPTKKTKKKNRQSKEEKSSEKSPQTNT